MSLPPAVVHIKRKREDEAPPETLHIQNHGDSQDLKRHKHGEWVFQRVPPDTLEKQNGKAKQHAVVQNPWERRIPEIRTTQPGDDLRAHPSPGSKTLGAKKISRPLPATSISSASVSPESPRRFHMTRVTKVSQRISTTRGGHKEREIATFMEHVSTITSSEASLERLATQVNSQRKASKLSEALVQKDASENVERHTAPGSPPRALKKPGKKGTRGLNSAPPAITESTKFDLGSEALAAEMAKFSMETMGRQYPEQSMNIESVHPSKTVLPGTAPKFKPKAPAQRYHERQAINLPSSKHTECSSDEQKGCDDTDIDDENDYVVDTYVRVPAHTLELVPKDVGVLVIESEEQMQQFYEYGEDDSDDSDLFDEEIDENAEGNPNNEYPDEEVASDDEFDLNSYSYRVNASDDEEFDFDEASYSDDGNDLPWLQTFAARKQALEDDEDRDDF